jgi:hypothetical protein
VIVTCQERDRLILAFALALNDQNEAWDQWELARNPVELENAKHAIEAARNICQRLQTQLLAHCNQHGC